MDSGNLGISVGQPTLIPEGIQGMGGKWWVLRMWVAMLELIHLQPLRQKYLFSMECTQSSSNSLRTPMCIGKPGAGGWRTCRLWSAERGSRELPQNFLSILEKWKSQGHFDWRCSFNTLTQRKSQDYYLHPSWGCCELGEVPSLLPGLQWAGERAGSKHLLLTSWLGWRSLIFHRLNSEWTF